MAIAFAELHRAWFVLWPLYVLASFLALRTIMEYLRKGASNLFLLALPAMSVAVVNLVGMNMFDFYPRKRLDLYINRFDRVLGYPANNIALFFQHHRVIATLAIADYFGLVLGIFVACAAVSRLRGYDELVKAIPIFLLSGLVAPPLHWLFPVSGPQYALPNFPTIYTGQAHPISLTAIPNGLPSVHFALALIVLYLLRHWRWGIYVGAIHVVLTGLATLGLGEHYALDLIAAVPYTYLVIRLSRAAWIWTSTQERFLTNGFAR